MEHRDVGKEKGDEHHGITGFCPPSEGRQNGGMEGLGWGDPGTTPHGDQAIIYLEGEDLEHTFQHLRTAQDPFTVWMRQRTQDLFGVDLTQTDLGALSQFVFAGPSAQEDEAIYQALERMERLGMISP